jgi:hypothetical protein
MGVSMFYSVKKPLMINGVKRVPSVCYSMGLSELKDMQTLELKGLVRLYERKMTFVSGIAREADSDEAVLTNPTTVAVATPETEFKAIADDVV